MKEIEFKKEEIDKVIELLEECCHEVDDVDERLYEVIVELHRAKGFSELGLQDSPSIHYEMENQISECKTLISSLLEQLSDQVKLVEGFMDSDEQDENSTQLREEESETETEKIVEAVTGTSTQLIYGPPTPSNENKIPSSADDIINDNANRMQLAYGVLPPIKNREENNTIQVLYGPPTPSDGNGIPIPTDDIINDNANRVQLAYGVLPPIRNREGNQNIQILYGPPSSFPEKGAVPIQNDISENVSPTLPAETISSVIENPITSISTNSTPIPPMDNSSVPSTPSVASFPEYEAIPKTGVETTLSNTDIGALGGFAGATIATVGYHINKAMEEDEEKESNHDEKENSQNKTEEF